MMKRFWALMLTFALVLPMCPVHTFATETEEEAATYGTLAKTYVNPLYADVISEDDLNRSSGVMAAGDVEYYATVSEAGAAIRDQLEARQQTITVGFQTTGYDSTNDTYIFAIMDAAMSHTGVPTEGDYLMWHYAGWDLGGSYYINDGVYYLTYVYTMTYYTTSTQEAEVTAAVNTIVNGCTETTDYGKIAYIYDYLCDHVTYDHANLENESYTLKYSAYAALINKTAVCQGYASAFYRLALEMGVDARLIPGIGNGGDHGWNIVELDDVYYNVDATWDAGKTDYDYFLKCNANFADHTRAAEYATDSFHSAYPMSTVDYDPVLTTGILGSNLTWTLDKNYQLTISGSGAMEDVGWEAPWNSYADSITSVVIQEGVTSVGQNAFMNLSSLRSVSLPDSLETIGAFAFNNSALTELTIPKNVSSLGMMALYASNLNEINVDAENAYFSSDGQIMYNKDQTILHYVVSTYSGELKIPDTVTAIDQYAMYQCSGITAVTLPDGLLSIGLEAFEATSISSVSIPASVAFIEDYAFASCLNLKTIEVDADNAYFSSDANGALYDKSKTTLICLPCGFTGKYEMPGSVTTMSSKALSWVSGLTSVTLSENLSAISLQALEGCSALTEITIPASVTQIAPGAFSFCSGLVKIVFEGNAPTIDTTYFETLLNSLTATVYYPADNETWTEEVMESFGGNITWTSYEGSAEDGGEKEASNIDAGTFGENLTWTLDKNYVLTISGNGAMPDNEYGTAPWSAYSDKITSIVIGDGITYLGEYAFSNCFTATSLTIGSGVTEIGAYAIYYCSGLTSVTIPGNVKTLGDGAFFGCLGMQEVTISDGIENIGRAVFQGCDGLTSVTIPASVTTIAETAFLGCAALQSIQVAAGNANYSNDESGVLYNKDKTMLLQAPGAITAHQIPDTVTSIGNYAYSGCSNLTQVSIPVSVVSIGGYVFSNCQKLSAITVNAENAVFSSDASGVLYNKAKTQLLQAPGAITEYTVPDGVAEICTEAFYGCKNLTSVTISDTVTTLGYSAFNDCDSLKTVIIGSGVTSLDAFVFSSCDSLTEVRFMGDAPAVIQTNAFAGVKATVYYPADNNTWTEAVKQNYGGTITWMMEGSSDEEENTPATSGTCGDSAYWSFDEETGTLTISGTGDWSNTFIGTAIQATDIKNLVIEEGITNVAFHGFNGCTNLAGDLVLPDSITTIENFAFYGCTSLTNVTFPENLQTIGESSFLDTNLQNITLGDKVTYIYDRAFMNCTSLTSIEFQGDAPKIDDFAFSGVCATAYYPAGNTTWQENVLQQYGGTIIWIDSCFADHTAGEAVAENVKSAGCETSGSYDSVIYCSVCDDELSRETITVNPNGHSYGSWYTATAAGCTTEGLQRRDCNNCDHYETQAISANGHSYSATVTAPTCENQGYTTYTCACGHSYVGNSTNPTGHSYGSWYTVTGAGCTTEGLQRRDCNNCDHYETQAISANGHSYSATVTAPTCENQGYTTYTCACGHSYVGNSTNSTGHSYGSWYTATAAGCNTDGLQRRDCNNCDHYETQPISANGHSYSATVTAPACENQGYTTYTCTCGHSYVGNSTNPTGHSYGSWYTATGAGCTTEGLQRRDCNNCVHYETQPISANGHSYSSAVTAATCQSQGYTTYTCSVCGHSYVDNYTEKTAHIYSDGACSCGKLEATTLSVTNVASSGKIKLSWTKNSNAVKYQVYRSTDNKNWKRIKTTTSTSYTDKAAEAGVKYTYKVRVVYSGTSNTSDSDVVSGICDLPRTKLSAATVASSGKIKLTWDEVEGAAKYYIYRKAKGESSYTKIKTTTSSSYTDKTAEAGIKYAYKVKAVHSNSAANSASSAVVSCTCDLPRTKVTAATVASSGKVKLSWDEVEGAAKYYIYRKAKGESEYTKIKTTKSTSYTDKSAEAGTKYSYKIKVIHSNTTANSAYSSVVSCTCDLPRPKASVSRNGSGQPKIKWAAVEDAVKYTVYRKASGESAYTKIKTTTSKSYTDKTAKEGVKYYYKVKAICSNTTANSAYSKVVSIKAK